MFRFLIVFLVLGAPAGALAAQEKPAGTQQAASGPSAVPVRLQLVLSRLQGEKKVSSMPYTLQLTVDEREMTILRMGTDMPVASGGGGFNYRSVGTNIDCRISRSIGEGQYKLQVVITDSSVRFPEKQNTPGPQAAGSDAPAFRTFTANFFILLRDGQTAQYTSASDPASGEVLKVDATLTVLK
jgi:hypothetical protein